MFVDWLSFTFKDPSVGEKEDLFEVFLDTFPMIRDYLAEMDVLDIRNTFYDAVLAFDNYFRISYMQISDQKQKDMGVNVSVPSHGLQKFCEIVELPVQGDHVDLFDLCKFLSDRHCKIGRIDIAEDDETFTYLPWDLHKMFKEGYIKTKCSIARHLDGKGHGTWYLGKRQSGRLLRVYDKQEESQGEINAIRWEIEFRDKYAAAFQQRVLKGEKFGFGDVVRGFMEILSDSKVHGSDKTVSRIPVDEDWIQFWLNSCFTQCFGIKITRSIPAATKTCSWLNRYCAPSIGVMASILDDDLAIAEWIRNCKTQMTKKHMNMIRRYKEAYGSQEDWIKAKFLNMDTIGDSSLDSLIELDVD